MRNLVASKLEDGRIREGPFGSDASYGLTGAFLVMGPTGEMLKIVASEGDREIPWEHVSVSCERRTPNWTEMCFVKDLWWRDDECVIQYHPPKAEYVNCHPFCLHLWKPLEADLPIPPSILVGPKT
jgi:hypothetical protein